MLLTLGLVAGGLVAMVAAMVALGKSRANAHSRPPVAARVAVGCVLFAIIVATGVLLGEGAGTLMVILLGPCIVVCAEV